MALTKIDFSQLENIDNTPTGLNINKSINFTQQLVISEIPFQQPSTPNIWFDKSPSNAGLKIRINSTVYDLKPKETLNNIIISSNYVFNLSGKRGIVNNLTISGSNITLTVRSGINDWSILEVQGDLIIPTGCTLNLIRTPLIVRGSILGGGTITSPDGVNGGLGGTGGPGGAGGTGLGGFPGGIFSQPPPYAGSAPTFGSPGWTNGAGGSASSMPIEYGINSGSGGNGGQGTGGGGVGGALSYVPGFDTLTEYWSYGGYSGNGNPGGNGYLNAGGGGGGAGGSGTSVAHPTQTGGPGGPGAWATPGISGNSAGTLSTSYIGLGTPSSANTAPSQGTSGGSTFGGAGGQGFSFTGQGLNGPTVLGSPGSPGGNGGNGGPGGSTGGAHLTVFCIGDISSSITFRPGRGGINGGLSTSPKAQTGSVWLFNKYGTTSPTTPGSYDIQGIGPSPSGPNGSVTRILITDDSSVNSFFRDILYNTNGISPAKEVVALTL
jgi:hypothetical protein